jgi:hypothetical protein
VRAEPGDLSRGEHHVASRGVPLIGPPVLNREAPQWSGALLRSGTRDFYRQERAA